MYTNIYICSTTFYDIGAIIWYNISMNNAFSGKIGLPGYVKTAIDTLERQGFEAYAVGGCVRDSLLGKPPADWDLCTSATPQQTLRAFPDNKMQPV